MPQPSTIAIASREGGLAPRSSADHRIAPMGQWVNGMSSLVAKSIPFPLMAKLMRQIDSVNDRLDFF
jgi:hypothetical protein